MMNSRVINRGKSWGYIRPEERKQIREQNINEEIRAYLKYRDTIHSKRTVLNTHPKPDWQDRVLKWFFDFCEGVVSKINDDNACYVMQESLRSRFQSCGLYWEYGEFATTEFKSYTTKALNPKRLASMIRFFNKAELHFIINYMLEEKYKNKMLNMLPKRFKQELRKISVYDYLNVYADPGDHGMLSINFDYTKGHNKHFNIDAFWHRLTKRKKRKR